MTDIAVKEGKRGQKNNGVARNSMGRVHEIVSKIDHENFTKLDHQIDQICLEMGWYLIFKQKYLIYYIAYLSLCDITSEISL